MHYLNNLLPVFALMAAVDALSTDQGLARRTDEAAGMPQMGGMEGSCPCSCSQPGAMKMSGGAGGMKMEGMKEGEGFVGANGSAGAGGGGAVAGAKAIYMQSNQDQNSVIVLPVQADGTLGAGTSIATGGTGGVLIDGMTNEPAKSDVLASQGAVRVLGDNLFVVNAGSNSLSMFAIDPQDPVKLTLVGQAVESGGDVRPFPASSYISLVSPLIYPPVLI
jgi:hypothetical protein